MAVKDCKTCIFFAVRKCRKHPKPTVRVCSQCRDKVQCGCYICGKDKMLYERERNE